MNTQPAEPMTGVGNPATLAAAYDRWKARYEASDTDRLLLALRATKGLSAEFVHALGRFELDLADGSVVVDVEGLEGEFDVWLVDNIAGPGKSVKVEEGDRLVRLGRLAPREEGLRLETQLEREQLADTELDRIIVARAGEHPGAGGLLFGAPNLFQRIYHGLQRETGDEQPRFRAAGFTFLIPVVAKKKDSYDKLLRDGEKLFFEETFKGNGRTCGTCHPADGNFTLTPTFIASLPKNDPLFVHEFNSKLKDLENADLLRTLALILENVDGFNNPPAFRASGNVQGIALTLNPAPNGEDGTTKPPHERTGWSGDGSPNGGTLREFAIGAVTQHFPKTLDREEGEDFRLPTEYELDAMEAFQLSVGPPEFPELKDLELKNPVAERGRELYLTEDSEGDTIAAAKCNSCHHNLGGNLSPFARSGHGLPDGEFNFNFDIGTHRQHDTSRHMVAPDAIEPDSGFGKAPNARDGGFGNGTFNVPAILFAPDTGLYFHGHSATTLENCISFYAGGTFASTSGADFLRDLDPGTGFNPITAENPDFGAVGSFMRVMNALENIRSFKVYFKEVRYTRGNFHERRFKAGVADLVDAIHVLEGGDLHPDAVKYLKKARAAATLSRGWSKALIKRALRYANKAHDLMIYD